MEKKKEFAVNYRVVFGGDCSFNQTVNISRQSFGKLKDALFCQITENAVEIEKNGYDHVDYYQHLYLKTPLERIGSMVFFNHTQRDFFNKRISQYLKRPLLDRNTCFCLIS